MVRRISEILIFVQSFAFEVEGVVVTCRFKNKDVVERQAGRCSELLPGEETVAIRRLGKRRLKHIRLSGNDGGNSTLADISPPMTS